MFDVIIIGAGAAGLMTAITAGRRGLNVLLLDGQKKIGAKILMSGGTRCNVTNQMINEKDYNSHAPILVRNILRGFDNQKAIQFFKDIGVELVLEDTGKYFPTTHSGKTVLDALLKETQRVGVHIKSEHRVTHCSGKEGVFYVEGDSFVFSAPQMVITTGGLSYPSTGSDGTGYRLAQSFGHSILQTQPALTPLACADEALKKLSGIALPVNLSLYVKNRKTLSLAGDFLFTHFGFSGPVVLDISRHWLYAEDQGAVIYVNFIPSHSQDTLEVFINHCAQKTPKKTVYHLLSGILPSRLTQTFMIKAGIKEELPLNQLNKEARRRMVAVCSHYPLELSGAVGYSKAEVTAGGVDFKELHPKVLESQLQSGLFFAGEILDVDGRIGGFNFQWAWASGHAVGQALKFSERNNNERR